MPDLLTHALVAYILAAVVAQSDRIQDRYVSVAMVGAVAPDAMKLSVLLNHSVGHIAGIPYSTWGVHTLGGVLVLAGLGALTIRVGDRFVAGAALAAGGASHLFLDAFVIRVDGVAPPYLFPFSGWLPPAANLYASTDVWPAAVALSVAVPVWLCRRRRGRRSE
ncbi:metal-dependent hydrolase [Haloplanus sp.]|uniref:metal-dependent hydrolase n=1 Tax=Haloplanus sp. TaxID=1961696 RepID=UPI00261197F0|nr:metal-dependent hydrolase [Haloplanus sp.]